MQQQRIQHPTVLTGLFDSLNVFGETEPVIELQVLIVFDGLFKLFRLVVNKDGILLHLISIDSDKLNLALFFNNLTQLG